MSIFSELFDEPFDDEAKYSQPKLFYQSTSTCNEEAELCACIDGDNDNSDHEDMHDLHINNEEDTSSTSPLQSNSGLDHHYQVINHLVDTSDNNNHQIIYKGQGKGKVILAQSAPTKKSFLSCRKRTKLSIVLSSPLRYIKREHTKFHTSSL